MPFSFEIEKSSNLQKTLANVKKEVEKHKGVFEGNAKEGKISSSGVKGRYVVTDDSIVITITDKPFGVPEFLVKGEILNIFEKFSV